jgi:hypothetical protein
MTGIPLYLLTRGVLGNDLAALLMVLVMLPLFAFALYEKDGMPLEAYIGNFIRVRFLYTRIRPYQTENFYRLLQSEITQRKEKIAHDQKKTHRTPKTKSSNTQKKAKA